MISHHHKCLFIHIPKNAGQSIEMMFINLLGLTWSTRAPLLLTTNSNPNLGPPRLAHLTATDYAKYKYISEEQFENYFKFAFVRNPWDRAVSFYKYMGKGSGKNFKDFICEDFLSVIWKQKYWFVRPQHEFIYENGEKLVDYVGRFENLKDDCKTAFDKMGLPFDDIPHVNSSKNRKPSKKRLVKLAASKLLGKRDAHETHDHYTDYFDDTTIEIIQNLYEKDLEIFNYQYPK